MYKSNTNITVRYVETDQMGIVQHSIEKLSPAKVILNYDVIRKADNKVISRGENIQVFGLN